MTRVELLEKRLAKHNAKVVTEKREAKLALKKAARTRVRSRIKEMKRINTCDWGVFMGATELHERMKNRLHGLIQSTPEGCGLFTRPPRYKEDGSPAPVDTRPPKDTYLTINYNVDVLHACEGHGEWVEKRKVKLQLNVLRLAVFLLKGQRTDYSPRSKIRHSCGNPFCLEPNHLEWIVGD